MWWLGRPVIFDPKLVKIRCAWCCALCNDGTLALHTLDKRVKRTEIEIGPVYLRVKTLAVNVLGDSVPGGLPASGWAKHRVRSWVVTRSLLANRGPVFRSHNQAALVTEERRSWLRGSWLRVESWSPASSSSEEQRQTPSYSSQDTGLVVSSSAAAGAGGA